MHILFLTDNFPPEVNAPASRTFEHAREWVRAGHEVTVITCVPNFPAGKIFEGYQNKWKQEEEIDGIRIVRVWSYITANEGFLKRTLDYISFASTGTLAALSVGRVDVVVGTSPQFFTALAAFCTSILKWKPWVFELRDLWPESIKAVGAINEGLTLQALEALELFLYRRSKKIVSVTNSFKQNLIRRGIEGDKISVITNGADLAQYAPRGKPKNLQDRLKLDGKFIAGYIGTHGMAHGLDTLLDAAAILKDEPQGSDICIVLLGNGARKQSLVRRAQELKLSNVLFVDSVPKSEVVDYWALLDVSIIHLKKDPLFTTVIPSKLFECMAMGLPVLHGVEGESRDIVEREGVGEAFEPENAAELAQRLVALRNDPAKLVKYGENAKAAAPKYDRNVLAAHMLSVLSEAAGEPARPAP